jgi:hypothetical protein
VHGGKVESKKVSGENEKVGRIGESGILYFVHTHSFCVVVEV